MRDIGDATDEPVILVCRSGRRAAAAVRELQGADLCALHVLDGGLGAWEAAGLPLNRGRQRWSMERQVRGVAGTLVLVGLLASLKVKPAALLSMAVGGGLLSSSGSDTCTMARVLSKLPYNQGAGCDIEHVLGEMAARRQPVMAAAD